MSLVGGELSSSFHSSSTCHAWSAHQALGLKDQDKRTLTPTLRACAVLITSVLSNSLRPYCSPRGSSVQGIIQARILEWIAMPTSWRRDQTIVSYISCAGSQVLYHKHYLGSPYTRTDIAKHTHIHMLTRVCLCLDILWVLRSGKTLTGTDFSTW